MARRTPRYPAFLLSGAALGVVVAVVVWVLRGGIVQRPGALLFYLVVVLVGLGALAGGVVAVLLEGRRRT